MMASNVGPSLKKKGPDHTTVKDVFDYENVASLDSHALHLFLIPDEQQAVS